MINVAVIGAGNWGKNLVRNFAGLPGVSLKYVCDLQEKTRKTMASLYPGATVVDDTGVVFGDGDVNAVVVAVDAPYHFKIAKAALESGKHVFVEKPLTLASSESAQLNALAQENGLKLMVGHLLEYHPAVDYMKRAIESGEVGRTFYLYFQRVNLGVVRSAENAWWSLAPHDVSVACYLFGDTPISVSACGQDYLQNGIEDVVFANLKFADGRMANIHVSWLDPHKIRKVTLVGEKRMIVFDDMEAAEKIRVYDKGADVKPGVASYAEAISLRIGDILIPKLPGGEPLRTECQHFIDSIVNDTQPRSDGADGLRVVKVLEAGSLSLERGGEPVTIS